jgi:hypothetical protein
MNFEFSTREPTENRAYINGIEKSNRDISILK